MTISTFVPDKFIERIIAKLNKLFFIFERRNPLRIPFFLELQSNLYFQLINRGLNFEPLLFCGGGGR